MRRRHILYSIVFLLFPFLNVNAQSIDSVSVSTAELADLLVKEAERYIGVPYRMGGKGPKSFDCSGYTRYVYGKFGIDLSVNSATQATQGREVTGPVSNLQKGDILVFGMRNNRKRIGHVGIYIGPDESGDSFLFIHASRKGVRISNSNEEYWSSRFLGVRRFLPDFLPGVGDGSADSIDSTFVAFRDTLTLTENDFRIILLSDGTWAYVLEDGTVQRPSCQRDKLVLDTNGRWTSLPVSMHTIPSLSKPMTEPAQSSSESPSASSAVATVSEKAVYHTIRQGDTLSAIAKKYRTTVNAICSLNGISSRMTLKPGKKLRVK